MTFTINGPQFLRANPRGYNRGPKWAGVHFRKFAGAGKGKKFQKLLVRNEHTVCAERWLIGSPGNDDFRKCLGWRSCDGFLRCSGGGKEVQDGEQ